MSGKCVDCGGDIVFTRSLCDGCLRKRKLLNNAVSKAKIKAYHLAIEKGLSVEQAKLVAKEAAKSARENYKKPKRGTCTECGADITSARGNKRYCDPCRRIKTAETNANSIIRQDLVKLFVSGGMSVEDARNKARAQV